MRDPHCLELARRARQEAGSVGPVAEKIGYARPTLSRYLNDPDYPSSPTIEAAIRAAYDRRTCPHNGADIDAEACQRRVSLPRSHGNPVAAAHWDTCQTCQYNPKGEQS